MGTPNSARRQHHRLQCSSSSGTLCRDVASGGPWGHMLPTPPFWAEQLNLSQRGWQIMPTTVLCAPQDFRPCDGPALLSAKEERKASDASHVLVQICTLSTSWFFFLLYNSSPPSPPPPGQRWWSRLKLSPNWQRLRPVPPCCRTSPATAATAKPRPKIWPSKKWSTFLLTTTNCRPLRRKEKRRGPTRPFARATSRC